LYDADVVTIRSKFLADYVTTNTSGAKKGQDFGSIDIDHRGKAKTFLLHPSDKPDMSDQTEDFYFHLALLDARSIKFLGSQKKFQSYDLAFQFLPDFNQSLSKTFGTYGYRNITDTPLGSWIQANKTANVPGKHIYGITLRTGQNEQMQGFNGYGDVVSTSTCVVANTGGYAATATSIDIDTIVGTLVAGYYRNAITGEVFKVAAYSSGTLSSITRGCWGTEAQAMADGESIAYISSPSVERHTDEGDWTTSAVANVAIGDTYMGVDTNNKGVISHGGSDGTANIIFTYGAVASPAMVATSAAVA
jgi:hypothetical protein